jgi:phosphopantothenoylcysteine decarboxylase/phosphopantothenate--cysteine ligase
MHALDTHITDCFIAVAAVADWRPADDLRHKIKKEAGSGLEGIAWVENPDILASVARRRDPPFCVGFAAETGSIDDLHQLLPPKRLRKGVPLLAGNIGPDTFGADHNQLLLCSEEGFELLPPADKATLARELILRIAQHVRRNAS